MTKRLAVVFMVLALFGVNALAQRITGNISGQITDPQGAVISGAKVTISHAESAYSNTVTTTGEGTFFVPDLRPAVYTVTIEMQGYSKYRTTSTVRVGQTANLNAKLTVGTVEEVVVEGTAVTVDTVNQTVQGVVTSTQIDAIPLNGRNFLDLASQQPGVQVVDGGALIPPRTSFPVFPWAAAAAALPASR